MFCLCCVEWQGCAVGRGQEIGWTSSILCRCAASRCFVVRCFVHLWFVLCLQRAEKQRALAAEDAVRMLVNGRRVFLFDAKEGRAESFLFLNPQEGKSGALF